MVKERTTTIVTKKLKKFKKMFDNIKYLCYYNDIGNE